MLIFLSDHVVDEHGSCINRYMKVGDYDKNKIPNQISQYHNENSEFSNFLIY